MKQNLETDREFMRLCIPASDDDTERLELSLLRQGCLEPIITWNGIILDGYKRYQICCYEEIDFEITEMDFNSREEAVVWICRQRILKLQKHTFLYRYIVGKWYLNQRMIDRENRKQLYLSMGIDEELSEEQKLHLYTSLNIGTELQISRCTVARNGPFAEAVDHIADIVPSLYQALLTGKVHFQKKEILEMGKMDERQLEAIKRKKLDKQGRMRQKNVGKIKLKKDIGSAESRNEKQLKVGIKEMPAFDPDMELRGLLFTVPSWISAIARAQQNTDMNIATHNTKEQLSATLRRLEEQIRSTLEVLK